MTSKRLYGYHAPERAGGELSMQWMPLPADCVLRVGVLGLPTPSACLRLQCAELVLEDVLSNCPGAAACTRRCDVAFTAHGVELQIVDNTMAMRTGCERLACTVLVDVEPGKPDRVAQLLRLVVTQHNARGCHGAAVC